MFIPHLNNVWSVIQMLRSVHSILLTGWGSPCLSGTLVSRHSRDYQVVVRGGSTQRWGGMDPGIISKQRVQLLTQHWPWKCSCSRSQPNSPHSLTQCIAWMADGKDVVSECKDFDNIVSDHRNTYRELQRKAQRGESYHGRTK